MKINYAKETLSLNVEDIESVIVDDVTKLNNAIANIKGLSAQEVEDKTWENAMCLYPRVREHFFKNVAGE